MIEHIKRMRFAIFFCADNGDDSLRWYEENVRRQWKYGKIYVTVKKHSSGISTCEKLDKSLCLSHHVNSHLRHLVTPRNLINFVYFWMSVYSQWRKNGRKKSFLRTVQFDDVIYGHGHGTAPTVNILVLNYAWTPIEANLLINWKYVKAILFSIIYCCILSLSKYTLVKLKYNSNWKSEFISPSYLFFISNLLKASCKTRLE